MFQFFPFTNAHQLNLDWILETLKTFPRTVNNTYPDDQGNINLPTVAGMSSWNGIGADGAGNVDPVEIIADLDNAVTGLHFYRWENPDTANNPFGAAENTGYMTGAGGGICVSYVSAGGHAVQIANNAGCDTVAIRFLNAGAPWSSWSYPIVSCDIQANIVLNSTNLDLNEAYEVQAKIQNGWCFGYVEGKAAGVLSGNMEIASGFPVPLIAPLQKAHFTGIVKMMSSPYSIPVRFAIDSSGALCFDYLGNTEQAGDIIAVSFAYPIK